MTESPTREQMNEVDIIALDYPDAPLTCRPEPDGSLHVCATVRGERNPYGYGTADNLVIIILDEDGGRHWRNS